MIRRLKNLGANNEELLDVYIKQVRSVLELAVPVWQPGLTQLETQQIERVQKCAMHIILGENYIDYYDASEKLNCDTLVSRRIKLCNKFKKEASKSTRYRIWFTLKTTSPPVINTRQNKKELTSANKTQQKQVNTNNSIPTFSL